MTPMTFPMSTVYRACLWALMGIAALAVVATLPELLGIVPRGELLGRASDAERLAGLLVGLALVPFAWTALRHARITLDGEQLRFLRFGFLCRTDGIPLRRIRRFGEGYEYNRGRRRRILLLELDDGSRRAIKIAMYEGQRRLLEELGARLGQDPAPTEAGFLGVRFDDEE